VNLSRAQETRGKVFPKEKQQKEGESNKKREPGKSRKWQFEKRENLMS